MGTVEFANAQWMPYLISFTIIMLAIFAAWLRRRWFFIRFYGRRGGRIHGQFRAFCYVLLMLLVGIALGLSLCAPYIKKERPYDVYERLDAVVLVDVSKSMFAPSTEDPCSPSRLELATNEVESFIDLMETEGSVKAALVAFARYAYPAIPVPTDDYKLYRRRLKMETRPENVLEMPEGTDHWHALNRAVSIFGDKGPKKRLIAIITDGEPDLPGSGLHGSKANAIRTARKMGIDVYVIGVGEPGLVHSVPLARLPDGCPDEDMGYMIQAGGDEKGQTMTTATDMHYLMKLASDLGGEYIHSTEGSALSERTKEGILKEREKLGVRYKTTYFDLSEYLISAALAMLAALVLTRTP